MRRGPRKEEKIELVLGGRDLGMLQSRKAQRRSRASP